MKNRIKNVAKIVASVFFLICIESKMCYMCVTNLHCVHEVCIQWECHYLNCIYLCHYSNSNSNSKMNNLKMPLQNILCINGQKNCSSLNVKFGTYISVEFRPFSTCPPPILFGFSTAMLLWSCIHAKRKYTMHKFCSFFPSPMWGWNI